MSAELVAVLLIFAVATAQSAFIVIYGIWSPWWRTWLGRAVFTKGLGLALLADLALAHNLLGEEYPGRDVIRLTIFTLLAVGAWLQLAVLISEKRKPRRDRPDGMS